MKCDEVREKLNDMLAEGDDPATCSQIKEHASRCSDCARYFTQMRQTWIIVQPIDKISASAGFKERTMNRIATMPNASPRPVPHKRLLGSRLYWKIAAAAAFMLLLLCFTPARNIIKIDMPAYALDQTLEANRKLRSIHLQMERIGYGIDRELWLELNDAGQLKRLRMNFLKTDDGDKDIVWQNGKAEIYFKDKKGHVIVEEPGMNQHILAEMEELNPCEVMGKIKREEAAGELEIKTQPPAKPGEPIILTVTRKNDPGRGMICHVDPESKLLTMMERYSDTDGGRLTENRTRYLDYNKPLPDDVFKLNVPAEITSVDQTKTKIGLEKGSLSDNEICQKVAREFFEALIAGDYDRAGIVYEGVPGKELKKMLKGLKVYRIESIGEPYPHPIKGTRGIVVPCKVEVEFEGKRDVGDFKPGIRQVYSQPGRWSIFGGI